MGVLNIIYRTIIMLVCSIIQVLGVLTKGVHELFGKCTEYLGVAHDWLFSRIGKVKKKEKTARIDFPM